MAWGNYRYAVMNSVSANAVAIESGTVQIFDHIENEGPMWHGNGKRWSRAVVYFDETFTFPPAVQLSLAMIDADSGRNLRLELHAEDVRPQGFTAVAHTWSDSRIGRLQLNWTAIGSRIEGAEPVWQV